MKLRTFTRLLVAAVAIAWLGIGLLFVSGLHAVGWSLLIVGMVLALIVCEADLLLFRRRLG